MACMDSPLVRKKMQGNIYHLFADFPLPCLTTSREGQTLDPRVTQPTLKPPEVALVQISHKGLLIIFVYVCSCFLTINSFLAGF